MIQDAIDGVIEWLDAHGGTATLEEVNDKRSGKHGEPLLARSKSPKTELQAVVNPITAKLYDGPHPTHKEL
jgi:hypothetical protein